MASKSSSRPAKKPAVSAKKATAKPSKHPAVKAAPKKSVGKVSATKSAPKPAKTAPKTVVKSPPPARKLTPVAPAKAPKPTAPAKSPPKPPVKSPLSQQKSAPVSPPKSSAKTDAPAPPKVAPKPTPAVSSSPKKTPASDSAPAAKPTKKSSAREALRSRILGRTKAPKAISFSLDEVVEIAKTSSTKEDSAATTKAAKAASKTAALEASLKVAKPTVVGAASLADILGFNPASGRKAVFEDPELVPEKFRRYYKLLLELRTHLTGQIDQHSEETLKRSSKDDAGDLSSYGQHMADAGTDTFDRDFALSLVANEQEALSEIEAAITRIKNGSYGNCEVTGKPIAKERLLAVPFTRYSAEAQKEIERNRHRVRTQAGLFGEFGEDGGSISEAGGDDD